MIGGVGGAIGARRVKMTAMPQMVALFNGFGGGAAALVALADYHDTVSLPGHVPARIIISILFSSVIGAVSFSGSMIAFGKLQEVIAGSPVVLPGQRVITALARGRRARPVRHPRHRPREPAPARRRRWCIGFLLGVQMVMAIGGADMPVVISLLNAFTGLATASTGFVLGNNVLIIAGTLVGASGTLLTQMMGRAMNRTIANVIFGAFGTGSSGARRGRPGRRATARCGRPPPRTWP